MCTNNAFNGAKTAYMDFYAYIDETIKEFGMDRICALMTKSDEARGVKVGKMIKEQAGGKVFDANETAQTILDMAKEIGATDDVLEKSTDKVVTVTKFGNCPLYEAAKETGMDDKTIETLCHAGALVFFDNMVKQLNPKLSYRLRSFRSVDDGGCVEEIVLDDGEK